MNQLERTAWLESRRNGIGSSDVAKVLGLSKWGTALNVYLAKVAPARAEELTPPQEWGHRLEPVISAAVMDHHGWKLSKVPTIRHADHEFLIASPDRVNEAGELVEIKTTSRAEGWGESETNEIPEQYWLQCQHQLEVASSADPSIETCWVFVLIGQCDFRRYRVQKDPEYLPTVIEPLTEFWQHVEARNPPEPDWTHPATLAAVQRLFVPKPGTVIELSYAEKALADVYATLGEEIKDREEQRTAAKGQLIAAMGEFEHGNLPDGRVIARKQVNRAGYEVKPASYFDFRIKKAKGDK